MDRIVEIVCTANHDVVYIVPTMNNLRRAFRPGTHMRVPFEEVQNALCEYGVEKLFELGYLRIPSTKDAIDLGLIEESDEAPQVNDSIADIFQSKDNSKIFNAIKDATGARKDEIIDYVVSHGITDSNVTKWCKKYLQYDVLTAIALTESNDDDE